MDIWPATRPFEINKSSKDGIVNFSIYVVNDRLLEGNEIFCANLTVLNHTGFFDVRSPPMPITLVDDDCESYG